MNGSYRWAGMAMVVVGSAALVAQGPGGFGFGGGFGGPRGMHAVVTGEPFTDASTSTSVEKLAGGTTITHTSTSTEARDNDGRTVIATTLTESGGKSITRTTVMDPVAHTVTSWSTGSTTAIQMQLPTPPPGGGHGPRGGPGVGGPGPGGPGRGGPGGSGRVEPTMTKTTLSPTTIAGVSATGEKTTITVPTGAEGNSAPLVSTREVWTATDLKIVLLEKSDSARDGTHTMTVTSLNVGTPDPTLFLVPSGYTVKAEGRGHRGQ